MDGEGIQYNMVQLYCLWVEKFAFWLVIYIKHSIRFTIKHEQFSQSVCLCGCGSLGWGVGGWGWGGGRDGVTGGEKVQSCSKHFLTKHFRLEINSCVLILILISFHMLQSPPVAAPNVANNYAGWFTPRISVWQYFTFKLWTLLPLHGSVCIIPFHVPRGRYTCFIQMSGWRTSVEGNCCGSRF